MINHRMLTLILSMGLISTSHGISPIKMRFLSAIASLAGGYSLSCNGSLEWVKPAWATKRIPNGIPKKLNDQIEFLRHPERFKKLGAEFPRGMLLYGPPGTGKTSIARAIADELNAPFIAATGTDFTASLYGQGSRLVHDFFATARKEAENHKGVTIAFVDEIDLVVPNRNALSARGYGEQVTAFLSELDGFIQDPKTNLYLIATTNRKESIDPAILRAGRLETHIEIPLPTQEGRESIARHYLSKIRYKGKDMSQELALNTPNMSGADLKKIINDAAIIAGIDNASYVTEKHIRTVIQNLTIN